MSRHTTVEIVEQNDAAVGTDTDGTTVEEQFETTGIRPSVPRDPPPHDTVDRCFDQLKRLLREVPRGFPAKTCTIFRIPKLLRGINPKAEEPEIVSIGPYHRDKPQVLEFERLKPLFLERFLLRTGEDLKELTALVAKMESSARACYSEHVNMTSCDFVQMMLLDGCFVAEFLLHISESSDATDEHDPIFARPQIIPILIRDLLKLENQIPFSLLQSVFTRAVPSELRREIGSLATLALKLFNLACPTALLKRSEDLEYEHLLALFYSSLSPIKQVHRKSRKKVCPLAQSVPCVTELRPSGIKFKPGKAESFLEISFHKPVLQIPNIIINDFMTTVLINCVSLEQCWENRSKYMTDYVFFMYCLINRPKDVSLLRSDGIITLFSHDDQYVADLFYMLGRSISFNDHDCFLSRQFMELELYYRSNWANMMRTYFSSPWSLISAFSAFLVIVLAIIQTVIAVLTYGFHR